MSPLGGSGSVMKRRLVFEIIPASHLYSIAFALTDLMIMIIITQYSVLVVARCNLSFQYGIIYE